MTTAADDEDVLDGGEVIRECLDERCGAVDRLLCVVGGGREGRNGVLRSVVAEQFADEFEAGARTSRELAPRYREAADATGCVFVDAGQHVATSDVDGVHLDAAAHVALGRAIAEVVRHALRD